VPFSSVLNKHVNGLVEKKQGGEALAKALLKDHERNQRQFSIYNVECKSSCA
jgi:hypothetical protein